MRTGDDEQDDGQSLPTDGLEVVEIDDDETIRVFIKAWRRRVRQEYARTILGSYGENRSRLPVR